MSELLAIVRRIAIVSAIVVFCGAAACDLHPVEIAYAPGYGYVVHVQKSRPKTEKLYFVFPTEERAREFYGQYYADENWPGGSVRPGEIGYKWSGNGYEDYEQIHRTKIPLSQYSPPPPPLNEVEIPLATPDLPQPIPQTPQ